jgi:hypothetical protein
MSGAVQISFILVLITFMLFFCAYQIEKTIQDLENEPIGGYKKDHRLWRWFVRKKKEKPNE